MQITTTQRYLHLSTDDLSASHQKLSILNRLGDAAESKVSSALRRMSEWRKSSSAPSHLLNNPQETGAGGLVLKLTD